MLKSTESRAKMVRIDPGKSFVTSVCNSISSPRSKWINTLKSCRIVHGRDQVLCKYWLWLSSLSRWCFLWIHLRVIQQFHWHSFEVPQWEGYWPWISSAMYVGTPLHMLTMDFPNCSRLSTLLGLMEYIRPLGGGPLGPSPWSWV